MEDHSWTPTILVVDDDPGLLLLIEETLQRENCHVVTAGSGAEAMVRLRKHPPDLLLLDLKLKDIEGREFINLLAQQNLSLPFIIITGQGDERVAVEMMKRGALDYLIKDVNLLDFIPAVIQRALRHLADGRKITEAQSQAVKSRLLTQSVLNSLGADVTVLDKNGVIINVNEPWHPPGRARKRKPLVGVADIGTNYLDACRQAAQDGKSEAADILAGIQSVINGTRPDFYLEYGSLEGGLPKWFTLTVTPLILQDGGVVISHTDVTSRKMAEMSFHDQKVRYQSLVEMSPDAIFVNHQDRITFINAAGLRLLGAGTPDEVLGKSPRTFFGGDPGTTWPPDVLQLLNGEGTRREMEHTLLRLEGEPVPVELRASAFPQADGVAVQVIVRDISERKRNEQRLQLQYETSGLLAASASVQETIPRLLLGIGQILRSDVAEFWEPTVPDAGFKRTYAWHGAHRSLAAFSLSSAAGTLPIKGSLVGEVFSCGHSIWVADISSSPFFHRKAAAARVGLRSAIALPVRLDGQSLGIISFLGQKMTAPDHDLLEVLGSLGNQIGQFIERKRAEDALREANEFGRQVLGGAQTGIVVCDMKGRLVVWNPFMEQITGHPAASLQGVGMVEAFPFLKQRDFDKLLARSAAGEVFEAADIPFDHPVTGVRCWTTVHFAPWRDARQQIVGSIIAVRDITERRRLEAELLEISDREQQRIGHDLHDSLGQQLTGLEMKNFLLLEDLSTLDLNSHRDQLLEQSRKISERLRDCITFTRSLARGLAPVNIKAGGLAGALRQLAHNTNVPGKIDCRFVCRNHVSLDNPVVEGHLFRIAQEALNNALKHAQAGRIHISLSQDEELLRLKIKDDGRGLSPKLAAGMGLDVIRHRAQVIGATLKIDSKPGHGVEILCTFPVKSS